MLQKKTILTILIVFTLIFPNYSFSAMVKKDMVQPKKVLIVPGHDDEIFGAKYANMKESDMNRVLASQIYTLLSKDKRFEVYLTRNSAGYTKIFKDYFVSNRATIIDFKNTAKEKMVDKIEAGDFVTEVGVPHNSVTEDTAVKLYGINKWANDNKIDAVIHIHFDDNNRESFWDIGPYKGFSIYYPDGELVNSVQSKALGKSIFSKMNTKYQVSTYEKEAIGLVPDQKLIALGSNATLDKSVRSVLIEYGYIYEKVFRKSITRHAAYKTMADLTVKGIKSYFFPTK